MNEQKLMRSIITGIMSPIVLHEQCQTQEENDEATIHLPCAKFDMMVNRICNDKQEPEIAISFNGTYKCASEIVVSNKTDSSITKSKPSM